MRERHVIGPKPEESEDCTLNIQAVFKVRESPKDEMKLTELMLALKNAITAGFNSQGFEDVEVKAKNRGRIDPERLAVSVQTSLQGMGYESFRRIRLELRKIVDDKLDKIGVNTLNL